MKRNPHEVQQLVRHYEQQLAKAPAPLWMEATDLLDVLDHFEQQNAYFESEQCMRLALRLHPDNPEVVIRRAYRLKNEGRLAEAEEVVRALPEQDTLDVRFFLAEIALSRLEFDRAEQLFNEGLKGEREIDAQLLAEDGEMPMGVSDLLLEVGELFLDYGSIARAQKFLKQIAADAPEHQRAQMLLAECAFQLGDTDTALRQLETLLDENPYYLDAWLMVADVSNEAKDFAKCSEAANFALAIEPHNEKALRFKAVAALGQEHYEEVLTVYEDYRTLYPNDYTMALSAGEILVNQGKFDAAREVLVRSNQMCPNENPDKARILSDIATTYAAQGNMPTAYDTLLGCCSLGSNYEEVLLQAVQMALHYRHLPFVVRALTHYLEVYTLTADTRLRIARMLCESNLFGEVGAVWEQLLKVTESGTTLAAPYLAYAARRLMRVREYHFWLAYALYEDPTTTQQIFRQIYPNAALSDYLTQARLEFPEAHT